MESCTENHLFVLNSDVLLPEKITPIESKNAESIGALSIALVAVVFGLIVLVDLLFHMPSFISGILQHFGIQ